MRIRIRESRYNDNNSFTYEHQPSGKSGSIQKRFVNKEKQKEVNEYGFAYTNQPSVYLQ